MSDSSNTPLSVDRAPLVIAHRGESWSNPENSRPAFDAAIRQPIDGIECDVQLSRDGVPFIYHDRTLRKIQGGGRRISELTAGELTDLDAGRWFSRAFAGTGLMRLEEFLDRYAGRTRLLIELKPRERKDEERRHRLLAETVTRIVSKAKGENFILCFDWNLLNLAHRIDQSLPLMWNVRKPFRNTSATRKQTSILTGVNCSTGRITRVFVERLHGLKKTVFSYTCNHSRVLSKLLNCGVDGVFSDRPSWIIEELRVRGAE